MLSTIVEILLYYLTCNVCHRSATSTIVEILLYYLTTKDTQMCILDLQ